ncbi:MAG TPA: hypothetical protein VM911_20070 [Pyrinomonadaceae bacterium]|jgi:hypothetical protein|nr:hypothetical protein [Pyrinomonadaceae bacterium]
MKRLLSYTFALALLSLFILAPKATAQAQQARTAAAPTAATLAPADVDRIVRSFTAKETQFREALNQYVFKRDAIIQTVGMGGQVSGEYHRISYFTFDDKGNRYEKITFFPMPTLAGLSLTTEDLEDLGGIQPFALEASKINQYNFTYVGKERIDELDLYVFDVGPKVMPNPKKSSERFFQGRIWVDDHDLQIVKVRGKGVPEGNKQRFPTFETYREQIDGRFWFPTYTYANEELVFDDGEVIHFRMKVTYSDFKRGRADVRITEIDDMGPGVDDQPQSKPETKPSPSPTTPPPTKP